MRFCFLMSQQGGSPLQVSLWRGLLGLGHQVSTFHNGRPRDFDVLVILNQSSHTQHYAYPDFPPYTTPVVFIDNAEYGYFTRLPHLFNKFSNTFTPAAMQHDTKNYHEQTRLKNYLQDKSFPYFLREMHTGRVYPSSYYSIDYPLTSTSVCYTPPNKDTYLKRRLDLYISWGASHPWRWHITRALRDVACRSYIKVIEEDGHPRLGHHEYLPGMESALASVSYDGYGSSSFRMTEVLVRCALLQGPIKHVMRYPLKDGVTCVGFDMNHSAGEFVSTNVGVKLKEILGSPEAAFEVYRSGYDHCMTYLTETRLASDFVDTIYMHDWGKTTPLDL